MPRRRPKRGRLWLNDGSCVRLRPERPDHVWAYDFVEDRTHDGRKFRMLVVVDEYTRECLAIAVARRLGADDVLAVLAELFVERGPPELIRSDNGPELTAKALCGWLDRLGASGACSSRPAVRGRTATARASSASCATSLLDREVFSTLREAEVLSAAWRHHYNTVRPHSALSHRPPAPEATPWPAAAATAPVRSGLGPPAVIH